MLAPGPDPTAAGQARRRLKVLVTASTYPRWCGDPEPGFVHEYCRRLAEYHEIHVLAPSAPGAAPEETLDGVQIHRFRYAPGRLESLVHDGGILGNLKRSRWKLLLLPLFALGQLAALVRLLRSLRPDLVHAHWLLPQGLLALLARALAGGVSAPVVVTSHGSDLNALRRWPLLTLLRQVLRRVEGLAVVSQPLADRARALVNGCQPVVIPMGVDVDSIFVPGPEPIDPSRRRAVFVGRLVEGKGLEVLIEALALLRELGTPWTLECIGDGPLRDAIEARVRSAGLAPLVRFHGAMSHDELPARLHVADVAVLPFTLEQGFGLVVVEAMACGKLVLASDTAAMRDLVSDGTTGLLVPRADPKAIAAALEWAADHPEDARVIAATGCELARREHGWDRRVADTLAWYQAILTPARRQDGQ